uniref:Uncharacterized protein n=1 Tax=Arundo donax TaxID=35708 RepID=A0A0A9CSP3_ARUDO
MHKLGSIFFRTNWSEVYRPACIIGISQEVYRKQFNSELAYQTGPYFTCLLCVSMAPIPIALLLAFWVLLELCFAI